MDVRTNHVSRLTNTADEERTPAFSPNGTLVAYAAGPGGFAATHIFVQPVRRGARRQITFGQSTYDLWPRFSEDGKRITFCRAALKRPYSMGGEKWDHWDIWIVDVDGRNLSRVTKGAYYSASSSGSCLGDTRIIYVADTGSSQDLSVWAIERPYSASASRRLTTGSEPACSRDGKHIVYMDDHKTAYEYEVWLMDADGTQRKQLTSFRSYKTNPVFAIHDRQILFLSDPKAHGQPQLWRVDIQGKKLQKLAGSELFNDPLKWKP